MTSADHAWASALERRLWLRCFRDRGWLTQTFRANQAAPCSRLGSAHTRKHGAALKPLVSILVEIARAACGSGQEARPVGRGSCPVRVIGGHCAPVRHWRAYAACSSGGRLSKPAGSLLEDSRMNWIPRFSAPQIRSLRLSFHHHSRDIFRRCARASLNTESYLASASDRFLVSFDAACAQLCLRS